MDEWTRKFIDENNRVFVILEGVCPECGQSLSIKSIGGLPSFLGNWHAPEGIEPTIWSYNPNSIEVGGIEFICENGHTFYVEQNSYGDWN